MSHFKPSRKVLLLCVVLTVAFLFAGCSALQEANEEHEKMCTAFVDALIAGETETAYDLIKETTSEEDFLTVFSNLHPLFSQIGSYELKQVGWHTRVQNGVTQYQTSYILTTDQGQTFGILLATREEVEGIYGLHIQDNTAFLEKTGFLNVVNIVLKVLSVAVIAFAVWMIVDCAKRKISKKPLWIIVILLGVSLGLTFGSAGFSTNFHVGLFISMSGASVDPVAGSAALNLVVPVGAILYFALRKRLEKKEFPVAVSEEASDYMPEEGSVAEPVTETSDVESEGDADANENKTET